MFVSERWFILHGEDSSLQKLREKLESTAQKLSESQSLPEVAVEAGLEVGHAGHAPKLSIWGTQISYREYMADGLLYIYIYMYIYIYIYIYIIVYIYIYIFIYLYLFIYLYIYIYIYIYICIYIYMYIYIYIYMYTYVSVCVCFFHTEKVPQYIAIFAPTAQISRDSRRYFADVLQPPKRFFFSFTAGVGALLS